MDNVHRITNYSYVREIYSDASTMGKGAVSGPHTASGQWSDHVATTTTTEFLAVFYCT